MVRKKRSPRTAEIELSKLTSIEKRSYVAKWQAMLKTGADEKRALNLHAVKCQVNQLKTKHTASSVVAALKVVYPERTTRNRLQRLHEIPPSVLNEAMRAFREAKVKVPGDPRSCQTLSISHLEALARCDKSDKRLRLLQNCAKHGWTATELRSKVVDKSDSRLVRPLELTLFVDDPRIPLDNNYGERLIRNPAVGRKNYYGSGSEWSGRLATMMFSIFATLILWKINPRAWLSWYFEACAANNGQAPINIEDFLPWNLPDDQLEELRNPILPASANTS